MSATPGAVMSAAGRRALGVATLLAATALAGACRESLDGGASCLGASALCPGQSVEIRDTIINPVLVFDSTYSGFPAVGGEFELPLVTRGAELETRAILRFDTLATFYVPVGDTNKVITRVDSARLRLILNRTKALLPDSVRFELYDVDDTTATDTSFTKVLARFTPQWKIGGLTLAKAAVLDTVYVPVSDSVVLQKLVDSVNSHGRLRVGVRVDGTGPVSLRFESVESGSPAVLRYRGTPDTAIAVLQNALASAGPLDRPDIRRDLMDYALVARTNVPEYAGTMNIGGIPGKRAYLRFDLPRRITDSTTVIRATLRLTQRPLPIGEATDTMSIFAHVVLATYQVTDNRRASSLIAPPGLLITDSLRVIPRDSGVRSLEMFDMVRTWAAQASLAHPPARAVVLRAASEGAIPVQAAFFSTTAALGLRPTMRLTYIPKISFGVP